VDLLLFLFFNTTTKTQKAEEIFNRFTDKNKVSVRGDILIDGEEYIIARQIERKMSKAGEWNVKTELEFFKKLADGQLQNFTGEQRRETEAFMKRSIGTMDDFLMTILTTASNLEDLLESKPTARGQVLSRFLGLEFLKKKEETGKEIYSEFSKGMISNVYNTETLKQDNESSTTEITRLKGEIQTATESIDEVDNSLKKGQEYKDGLLNSKHSDLSQELIILDPVKLQGDINSHGLTSKTIQSQIDAVKIVEPSGFYHEDKHDGVKELLTNHKILLGNTNHKVSEIELMVKKYGDGIECEHCGIKLMDASITKKKIGELDGLKEEVKIHNNLIEELDKEEKTYTQLKKEFDEYERNKLIKEKHEVSLESNELKLEALRLKLTRYEEVQDKIKQNNDIDAKLIKANLRIDELISQKRGYERIQSTNQNQIENLLARIEKNNGLVLKIAEEFEKEKIYKIYNEIYGKNGISKIIMKTMMPVINAELQRLLQDSCLFNLEIRINDKNEVDFIMIDNSTGIERPITSGSGYEKTVGALAIRAVLSKVCSLPKPQLSVYDEVWGKVANDNLDMVGEFFDKLKTYFEKIFVISHNPMISNWANTVVKITKTENVSKVSQ
jgi:DNA repair exonuclease SbcCD ATPase subunit